MEQLIIAVVAIVMAAGLLGTVVPLVPGLPLIWAAALVYGIISGFDVTGWVVMALISTLLVVGFAAKIVLPERRAAAKGAARSSIALGVVLALIGFFVIPVVGLAVGGVAGVLLGEYRRTHDWASARSSTKEVLIGLGLAAAVELAAGIAMIGCWVIWVALT